jgi:hypothetical protein
MLMLLVSAAGCSDDDPSGSATPDRVQVQHVLIGFLKAPAPGQSVGQSTIPGRMITRSKDEAEALAGNILAEAMAGAPFDTLVKIYTEDSFPGIYGISNFGVSANSSDNEYPRESLIPAFGDVSFGLSVGGISLAEYDPIQSPYGWHIIKRLK